jgi:hypothetical protein
MARAGSRITSKLVSLVSSGLRVCVSRLPPSLRPKLDSPKRPVTQDRNPEETIVSNLGTAREFARASRCLLKTVIVAVRNDNAAACAPNRVSTSRVITCR